MKILSYVKVHFFRNFEKIIAFAVAALIAAFMFQGISTVSFNGKACSKGNAVSATYAKSMVKSEKRSNSISSVKGKKTVKERTKTTNKKKVKKKVKKKSAAKKKTKSKRKSSTYKKTGNKVENRLNSAELKPKEFLKGKDEKILKKHLNKIIDDDMSNYKKAKVCYDYLIDNTHYAYGGWGNAIESVLENGYGTCTEYSYVYMAMMKYLGFNAKTVDGSTAMAAGGYGYHMWTEVKLNGNTYVFDPQVEDDMTNGKINYYRFCKTYSEVPGAYIK